MPIEQQSSPFSKPEHGAAWRACRHSRTMRIKTIKQGWSRNQRRKLDLWRHSSEAELAPNPPPWYLLLCELNISSIPNTAFNCPFYNLQLNVTLTALRYQESFVKEKVDRVDVFQATDWINNPNSMNRTCMMSTVFIVLPASIPSCRGRRPLPALLR